LKNCVIIAKSCFDYYYLLSNAILLIQTKKGNMMKKITYLVSVGLLTFGTQGMAEGLDELGEIKIVDESAKSELFQREKIVGCTDFMEKKELSCSKAPKDAILSKLPSSQQLEEINLEDEGNKESMKKQLNEILSELNTLKKEQKADKETILKLKGIINLLSTKKDNHLQMSIVKKEIKKIKPKKSKSRTATLIRKKIKEISRTDTEVVIEVQSNESLSTYAQAYYNDNTKYYKIYKANRNKIPKSMMIVIGERLTIPLD